MLVICDKCRFNPSEAPNEVWQILYDLHCQKCVFYDKRQDLFEARDEK